MALLATRNELPDFTKDPRLKEPAAAVADAERAIADAEARRDRAAALIVAIDADLAAVTTQKQANALEDRRDAALQAEADARKSLDRGTRALDRARKSHEPLLQAARTGCAKDLKAIHAAKVRVCVAKAEELKAATDELRLVDEHVQRLFPHEGTVNGMPHGLVGPGGEVWNAPYPLLGVHARLMQTLGRNCQRLDAWIALAREWTK
jgi:hypothetical protein